MSIPKVLTWNDRFALIDHFKPNKSNILRVFNITSAELQAAQQLRQNGTFIATKHLDYNSYASAFSSNLTSYKTMTTTKPEIQSITKPSEPQTSNKKRLKRGRKGNNIVTAFSKVPLKPVDANTFAKEHNVSIAVLRQSKRFDPQPNSGTIKVKKNKETGLLMIWRTTA